MGSSRCNYCCFNIKLLVNIMAINAKKYPILARLAIKFLGVPVTLYPIERVFI